MSTRYDLMLYLKQHEDEDLTQRDLRQAFGVARSTMSEALRSMVALKLIKDRAEDGRTLGETNEAWALWHPDD